VTSNPNDPYLSTTLRGKKKHFLDAHVFQVPVVEISSRNSPSIHSLLSFVAGGPAPQLQKPAHSPMSVPTREGQSTSCFTHNKVKGQCDIAHCCRCTMVSHPIVGQTCADHAAIGSVARHYEPPLLQDNPSQSSEQVPGRTREKYLDSHTAASPRCLNGNNENFPTRGNNTSNGS